MGDKIKKSDQEWRQSLTPMQYEVTRCKATERPFTGEYWNCRDEGMYRCVCCGAELFDSEAKFDSGCGWPSYTEPVAQDAVRFEDDLSHSMYRVEVLCSRCDAHLGHVFPDGPKPTGVRFCINSAALRLDKQK